MQDFRGPTLKSVHSQPIIAGFIKGHAHYLSLYQRFHGPTLKSVHALLRKAGLSKELAHFLRLCRIFAVQP